MWSDARVGWTRVMCVSHAPRSRPCCPNLGAVCATVHKGRQSRAMCGRSYLAALLVLYVGLEASAQCMYSHGAAGELARVSGAMACGDSAHGGTENLTSWTAAPIGGGGVTAPQPAGQQCSSNYVTPVENATAGTFGAVIKVTREGLDRTVILITYRMTVLQANCGPDMDEHLIPYPPQPNASVHRGFYGAYTSIREDTLRAVRQAVSSVQQVTRFVLTGYSLGGAMVNYLAMDLRRAYPSQPIMLYAFGTPRVGDAAFAAAFRAMNEVQAYLIWHRADPVPQCTLYEPNGAAGCTQFARGWRHAIPRTVWYPSDLNTTATLTQSPSGIASEAYVECASDSDSDGCRPPNAALTQADHLYYMGEGMLCCDPAPPNAPFLPMTITGVSFTDFAAQHCHTAFSEPIVCNPGHLHAPEAESRRDGLAKLLAKVEATANALQPSPY